MWETTCDLNNASNDDDTYYDTYYVISNIWFTKWSFYVNWKDRNIITGISDNNNEWATDDSNLSASTSDSPDPGPINNCDITDNFAEGIKLHSSVGGKLISGLKYNNNNQDNKIIVVSSQIWKHLLEWYHLYEIKSCNGTYENSDSTSDDNDYDYDANDKKKNEKIYTTIFPRKIIMINNKPIINLYPILLNMDKSIYTIPIDNIDNDEIQWRQKLQIGSRCDILCKVNSAYLQSKEQWREGVIISDIILGNSNDNNNIQSNNKDSLNNNNQKQIVQNNCTDNSNLLTVHCRGLFGEKQPICFVVSRYSRYISKPYTNTRDWRMQLRRYVKTMDHRF